MYDVIISPTPFSDNVSDINWSVAQSSFPLTIRLLSLPSYTYHALLGIIVSVGGLTESLVMK